MGREAQKVDTMTEELRRKLAALRAAAPALNKATDEATAVVAAVEKFLADLSIGLTLKAQSFLGVPAPAGDDEALTVFHSLAYGRVGGTYRVHVTAETCRKDDNYVDGWDTLSTEETPWSSCPREMKLQSFAKLPELLGMIADRALKLTEETTRTTETVRDLLSAMGPEPDDPSPQAGSNRNAGDKAWDRAGRGGTVQVQVAAVVEDDEDEDEDRGPVRVLMCRVGMKPIVEVIPCSLREMQEAIGCESIGCARIAKGLDLWHDDEGIRTKPLNRCGVHGDFFFAGADGDQSASLTDKEIAKCRAAWVADHRTDSPQWAHFFA